MMHPTSIAAIRQSPPSPRPLPRTAATSSSPDAVPCLDGQDENVGIPIRSPRDMLESSNSIRKHTLHCGPPSIEQLLITNWPCWLCSPWISHPHIRNTACEHHLTNLYTSKIQFKVQAFSPSPSTIPIPTLPSLTSHFAQ